MKVTASSAPAVAAQVEAQVRNPRSAAPAKRHKIRLSIRLALFFIDETRRLAALASLRTGLWLQALLSAVFRIASKGAGAFSRPRRQVRRLTHGGARGSLARVRPEAV
jgi:hypothetical protein